MEFKSLQNIETSFKQIRLFGLVFLVVCGAVTVYSVRSSYRFAEKQREKIYVLDEGKSLILALSQDAEANRPVEARDHVKRFHELFFNVSPDKKAIERNIEQAMYLADKSAYRYYKDLMEEGYYTRMIQRNVSQVVKVERFECNFDTYPYRITTYARQIIIRESNVTERTLTTSCSLTNSIRSDNNPHGFIIENFEIEDNKEIGNYDRR